MESLPADRTARPVVVELAAIIGLFGIAAGTIALGPTDLGFDRGAAIRALFAWIPATLPVGLLIFLTAAVDIGAGVMIARAIRGRPFEHLDEAILQGFVLAVIKDVALLGVLAGFGLFSQPILIGIHLLVLAAGILRVRPILADGGLPGVGPITFFSILLMVVWAPPILLQLASPIVPFMDVLPNHVAPAEHLRTFGAMTFLTDTQSPIYGSSRSFIGYTAFAGTVTTMSGQLAGQAIAGLILPSTLLVAAGVHRLARAVGGPHITGWALLLFAMTAPFARLGDARATVIVLPLVAWVLAVIADRINQDLEIDRRSGGDSTASGTTKPSTSPIMLGLGLGAALLFHPAIGSLAALTLAILILLRPASTSALAIPALGIGAVVALPELATVVGLPLPPLTLVVALCTALIAGLVLVRAAIWYRGLVAIGRLLLVIMGIAAIVIAGPVVQAAVGGIGPISAVMELSLVASIVAVILRTGGARSIVLWAALGAGLGVAGLTQLVPADDPGLLAATVRFELPKTIHYWVPLFLAILAASGLEGLVHRQAIPVIVRAGLVVAFVATAAMPIRTKPIDTLWLGEHRFSETLSIAMRAVERGFWEHYPDSRYVVDGPRREILVAVRAEIDARRIGPDTPILHVAGSFQQWRATPLGVFTGVTETDVTPDVEISIHTVGGRLRPVEDLTALLAGGAYPYVLFEPSPDDLPPEVRNLIIAAGYTSTFSNGQGELFMLAGR